MKNATTKITVVEMVTVICELGARSRIQAKAMLRQMGEEQKMVIARLALDRRAKLAAVHEKLRARYMPAK